MKLTDYIKDLGRVVAYYPNLRKITGSVTSSILLCQLLYWSDKSTDGWIYKTSDELEEETGMTYWEQETARKKLVDLGIIVEEYKRLDHEMAFIVNQDILNTLWENLGGKEITTIEPKEKEVPIVKTEETPLPRKIEKKGDWLDGVLASREYEGNTRAKQMVELKRKMENKLSINMDNPKWEKFIEFAWGREYRNNEPIDTFITYALREGFDPMFWTPEKCKTLYPQAFKKEESKLRENFVRKLPPMQEEEEIAPIPEELKAINRRKF